VDDLRPVLLSCRIGVISELVGGGLKNKILNFGSHRVPIFAFSEWVAGLRRELIKHLAIFAGTASLCAGIVRHIGDFTKLNEMQERAFGGSDLLRLASARRVDERGHTVGQ
jgi:polysaccharide biosynthesis protein PslH